MEIAALTLATLAALLSLINIAFLVWENHKRKLALEFRAEIQEYVASTNKKDKYFELIIVCANRSIEPCGIIKIDVFKGDVIQRIHSTAIKPSALIEPRGVLHSKIRFQILDKNMYDTIFSEQAGHVEIYTTQRKKKYIVPTNSKFN